MKKLCIIFFVILLALAAWACLQPNEYNERTRCEYRWMLSEGKR